MLYSSAFIKQCMKLFDDTKDHLDETQVKIKDLFNEIDASYLFRDWEINHYKTIEYKNAVLATKYYLMMVIPLIPSFFIQMNYFVIFLFTIFFAFQTLKFSSKIFRKSYTKISEKYHSITKKIFKTIDENLELSKKDLAEMDKLCKIFDYQVAEINKLTNGVQNEN
jgi:hypothetical protein